REGRTADRRRRHALQPDRVPRTRPRGDVLDLRDAVEGGGDPRRREGRLPARLGSRRPLAVRAARGRRARRGRRRDRRVPGAAELDRGRGPEAVLREAARELLASRADVWAFLSEPYRLSDWWPGILGLEPDRRGFAPGARWKVRYRISSRWG